MTNQTERIQSRIETSFLFTKEERESLMLLCVYPEFADVVAESLAAAFEAEDVTASALSKEVNRESRLLAKEIEMSESLREKAESHPVLV